MLLNRMGVDTEKLEEIEQKIEELESKENLNKEEKDKLESLMSARDQLLKMLCAARLKAAMTVNNPLVLAIFKNYNRGL